MATQSDAVVTAALRPDLFSEKGILGANRTLLVAALALLLLGGFGFRAWGLGAEGFGEDELNKLQAVADYRAHGVTAANSEHPMLMKVLQAASIVVADKWNDNSYVRARPSLTVSPEAALRFPGVIFGTLTIILIYLLTAEFFGPQVALLAAALWAFDPLAISFSRLAKEDTFVVFFFLLANVFWLRGQRVAESRGEREARRYYWFAAASFGAMIASKYLPQLLAISISYYWIFQTIPSTRWRLGKKRMLMFLLLMGAVFLLLNPAILLPATWRQMGQFAGEKLVGHDSYEFMGQLYSHRMTDWLKGMPWYFYFVVIAVKLPVPTVIAFALGLPHLLRRKIGDGRYFLFFWMIFWLITFAFAGGKFTRYFTSVLPAVLITAAIGTIETGKWLTRKVSSLPAAPGYVNAVLSLLVVFACVIASVASAPHYRLYTNVLGGGAARAGYYFPHDEFYDASLRELIAETAKVAKPGAKIASESPTLVEYYAERMNRPDLVSLYSSDPEALKQLNEGDFVIDERGRHYRSNSALLEAFRRSATPIFNAQLGDLPSAEVYQLDKSSLQILKYEADRMVSLKKSDLVPRVTSRM